MSKLWRKLLTVLGLVEKESPVIERGVLDMENSKAILRDIKAASGAIVNASTNVNPDPILVAARAAVTQTLEVTKEAAIQQGIDAIKKLTK